LAEGQCDAGAKIKLHIHSKMGNRQKPFQACKTWGHSDFSAGSYWPQVNMMPELKLNSIQCPALGKAASRQKVSELSQI
jgi:hypothetical protein